MSILVKARRSAFSARYFTIRGLAGSLGEDSRGVLTDKSDVRTLVTFFCAGEEYFALLEDPTLTFLGGSPDDRGPIPLRTNVEVRGPDLALSIAALPPTIEAYSRAMMTGSADAGSPSAILRYGAAHACVSATLIPGAAYTLGRGPHCAFVFDLPGIAPEHLSLARTGSGVEICPLGGNIRIHGVEYRRVVTVSENATVVLAASGAAIELEIAGETIRRESSMSFEARPRAADR